MSFSYGSGSNPPIDYPRFLVADTNSARYVFSDQEIQMATAIQGLQWQSGMFYGATMGQVSTPNPPVSYRRIAATLLDSLASNAAKLSSIIQLLDVQLDPGKAAEQLRAQAKCFRDEDDAGCFVMIEQVTDAWSFQQRWWNTVQRQIAQ